QVSVVVQKQSEIEYPKPDLLHLDGGGLQRSLGKMDFNRRPESELRTPLCAKMTSFAV
ncbi:MAG: hypothetical protein RLZZ329_2447, partial [Pseudomonadota bacterium]